MYLIIIGTIYYQKSEPYLLHASFSVYSLANCLFIFDAIYYLYSRAQIIYTFEHADGAGRATDLVIQPFVRFITLSFFPVFISTGMLYALVSYILFTQYSCVLPHFTFTTLPQYLRANSSLLIKALNVISFSNFRCWRNLVGMEFNF